MTVVVTAVFYPKPEKKQELAEAIRARHRGRPRGEGLRALRDP